MDILSGKFKSAGSRPGPVSAIIRTFRGVAAWLARLFTVTEEDRLKAGIYNGGKGLDE
jgi:hypothetical protein